MKLTDKDIPRFWSKVRKSDGCWMWQAALNEHGYGTFWLDGRMHPANRVSYLISFGPFDLNLCVCHTCDTPGCVRPDHLFLGTIADNSADMVRKGRAPMQRHPESSIFHHKRYPQPGEKNGSAKLTDENVRHILTSNEPAIELAQRYGVSKVRILQIKRGQGWNHLCPSSTDGSDDQANCLSGHVAALTYPAFARFVVGLEQGGDALDLGAQLADELAAHIA